MIHIRQMRPRDWENVCALFNRCTGHLPYHWPLHPAEFQNSMLYDAGPSELELQPDPAGWLVAVEGGVVWGVAQVLVSGSYLEVEPPQGWLRLFLLAPDAPLAAAKALLQAVDRYCKGHGLREITAFAPEGGYVNLLAGRGFLPGDRLDILRALGEAGYRLRDRWLMYERRIQRPQPEVLPRLTGLRLQWRSATEDHIEFWLHHGYAGIAHMQARLLSELSQRTEQPTASLDYLFVAEEQRRQGIGRWLLQRLANELYARGIQRLTLHINHQDAALQSLLLQTGYEELPLRGYTYEKHLS